MEGDQEGRRGKPSTRRAILSAAYHCFRDSGYHDAAVDEIVAAANVSKGTFYYHFKSKQAVFIAILEEWGKQIIEEIHKQWRNAVEGETLVEAAEGFDREIHRGRAIVPLWLEFTAHARREPPVQEALQAFYSRGRDAIATLLRQLGPLGLSEDEIEGLSGAILGAYAGLLMQDLAQPDAPIASSSVRQCVAVLRRLTNT